MNHLGLKHKTNMHPPYLKGGLDDEMVGLAIREVLDGQVGG